MPVIKMESKEIKIKSDYGTLKMYPTIENLTVEPSSIEQVFNHPNSYGYDTVTVKAVESDNLNITPTTQNQEYTGLYGTVNVSAVNSSIDSDIQPNNIKQGVNILGVQGNVEELNGEQIEITPSTSQQIITPSTNKNAIIEATIKAVTNTIDNNIQSKNIKKDVQILGVTGILENQIDSLAEGNITHIELEKATSVRNVCFQYLHDLITVTLGSTVKTIGDNAFNGCSNLQSVTMQSVTSTGLGVFQYCSNLVNVDLGDKLSNLGGSAFQSCSSLTHLVIPKGIITIRNNTFNGCTSMQFYDFTASTKVPSLQGTNAFNGIPSTCKIVVPDDLYETWITRTNWSNFASNIIKESEWNA